MLFYRRNGQRVELVEGLVEKLGENEEKVLVLLSRDATMSITSLAEKIRISTTAVENNINKLRDKGSLERKGPAKGGHWVAKK